MEDREHVTPDSVAEALDRVAEIDLSPMSGKLRHDDPEFWTDAALATAEQTYRRFLALNLLYPSETISVNRLLDEYWHQHILDTRKYALDCERLFGGLLHHYPYFGIGDVADQDANREAFAITERLWAAAFGSGLADDSMAGIEPRLTLDKTLGGYLESGDLVSSDIFTAPQGCKNGQHCNRVIVPREMDFHDPVVGVQRLQQ